MSRSKMPKAKDIASYWVDKLTCDYGKYWMSRRKRAFNRAFLLGLVQVEKPFK